MVNITVSSAPRSDETGPLRLVAQDIGFSVREQGFDSPRGYIWPVFDRLFSFLDFTQVVYLLAFA